ncbi:hypothetical protein GW756_05910 [bacterium]|nr:hypothetical protein [bacterium]NCQ55955.1 hypothetical protein [Candidatus Parcubacteria bacterium]NCS67980.1 hypothetical protein [Candidatus Peregrinibacteria bacterium]NCS96874.1 hypothetical protein [bacterium]
MANLNSVIKNNSGAKHTRKELMNKSPIPWLVIIGITAVAGGFLIYPNASMWIEKRSELKDMETLIPQLESENQALSTEKDTLEESFKEKAKPYIAIADQRFPTEIDTIKITQIIEMYSILMQVNYRANDLKLNTLSVSATRNVDGLPFAETGVNINVVIDREMLEQLIAFLKTSQISNELENKVIASGGGETASIEFLKANQLPVGRINSLSLNEERGRSQDSNKEVYNAQIQVLFYSEPV